MAKRSNTGSFLPLGRENEASTKKAAKGIIKDWTQVKPYNDPILTADEVDSFDMLDLVGHGAPDARVLSAEESLYPAPCRHCTINTCPGSIGVCLLNTNPTLALTGAEEEEDGNDESEDSKPDGRDYTIHEKSESIHGARAAINYVRSSGSSFRGNYARMIAGLSNPGFFAEE